MTEREILALFEMYHYDIYRFAYSFTGSRQDAEDVTQNTFLKLVETHPQLQEKKEKAWLMQVAANQCRNLLKSSWRKKTEPLYADVSKAFECEKETDLFYSVMSLSAKERAVVHLHYYEGYTQEEIAKMLKISSSAVSMRLHRARKHLKQFLEEEKDEQIIQRYI